MNELAAFTIDIDNGPVRVTGSARYDGVERAAAARRNLPNMAFEWTFHEPTDLWAFADMLAMPYGSPPAMRIDGRIDLNGLCLPIGAIRVIGRTWRPDLHTEPIRTLVESWGPEATDDELHVGYAAAFLSLAPAGRAQMIEEVRRACQRMPRTA